MIKPVFYREKISPYLKINCKLAFTLERAKAVGTPTDQICFNQNGNKEIGFPKKKFPEMSLWVVLMEIKIVFLIPQASYLYFFTWSINTI